MLETMALLLALTRTAVQTDLAPDLVGPYCSTMRARPGAAGSPGCCIGRMDECSEPILGTLCYCDTFCNRAVNPDCCPDYLNHCFGQELPTIPPPTGQGPVPVLACYHRGRYYRVGDKARINCNDCECAVMRGRAEMLCSSEACLVDPALADAVNGGQGRGQVLGWTARNFSEFWGRTLEEGRTLRLGTLQPSDAVLGMTPVHRGLDPPNLPRFFDVREAWPDVQVTGVQDQGWCGASWALSTAAVASDRYAIMSGGVETPRLSAQHLLDCNNNRNQHGCQGGHLDRAWFFTRKFGLVVDDCYPWTGTGEASKCRVPKRSTLETARCPLRAVRSPKASTELYRMGPAYRLAGEQDIMREIMMSGPVQATMQVYRDLFLYESGIYRHSPVAELERTGYHSVRILGWGEEGGVKYWLVANSWGEWWGEKGMFRIRRGINECRIEDFVLASWAHTHADHNSINSMSSTAFKSRRRNPLLDRESGHDNTLSAF